MEGMMKTKPITYSLGTLTSDLLASKKKNAAPRGGSKQLVAAFKKRKDKLPAAEETLNRRKAG